MKKVVLSLLFVAFSILTYAQCSSPSTGSTQNSPVTICSGSYESVTFNKALTVNSGNVYLSYPLFPTANSTITVNGGNLYIYAYPNLTIGGTFSQLAGDVGIEVTGGNIYMNGSLVVTCSYCQFQTDAHLLRVAGNTTITGTSSVAYPTLYAAIDTFRCIGTVTTNAYPYVDFSGVWDVPNGTTINCNYTCTLAKAWWENQRGLNGLCYYTASLR